MDEVKETIDQSGIIPGVEVDLFAPESSEEIGQEENGETAEPAAQAADTQVAAPQTNEIEPEKAEQTVAQPAGAAPRVYAEKFNSLEDLKHAFINLGGNPSRYTSDAALEEAYEVRQQEFSRSRQELATQQRLNTNIQPSPTPAQAGNPLDPEALLDKVQWDKVENARDLGRELIALMSEVVPKNQPNQPTETELINRIIPMMQEREARVNELSALESDIPRLKLVEGQENQFRNAFANHIIGEKNSNAYVDLKSSMKSFLNFGKLIVDEQGRQNEILRGDKLGAGPVADGGGSLPAGRSEDETDAIIGSYKGIKEKRGEI